MAENVTDRIYKKMDEFETPLCVGLDPVMEKLPGPLKREVAEEFLSGDYSDDEGMEAAAEAILRFNIAIIDATCDQVGLFKPQSAYYEVYGSHGIAALEETVEYARGKGAIVILDAKRNDIGRTSVAYAEAHLGKVLIPDGTYIRSADDVDMMTVNGYLGSDGIKPFAEVANRDGKGIFVLAKTSNKSSGELQNQKLLGEKFVPPDELEGQLPELLFSDGPEVYMEMARLINEWGAGNIGDSGYSNVGAVVGATYPEEAARLRAMLRQTLFLMPGYGTQGANADTLTNGFDEDGRGAIVGSSSGIGFAVNNPKFLEKHPEFVNEKTGWPDETQFAEAARQATLDSVVDINRALAEKGKLPRHWKAA